MPKFVQSSVIHAPLNVVFAFHEREDALPLLSPPFPPLRVVQKLGGIEAGARVELRIGPVKWVALHTAFEKNRLFVDEQIEGPFRKWIHQHEFEAVGDGTRLTDRLEFELPGGAFVNGVLGWAVKLGLRQMFAHRHSVTKTICEAEYRAKTIQ